MANAALKQRPSVTLRLHCPTCAQAVTVVLCGANSEAAPTPPTWRCTRPACGARPRLRSDLTVTVLLGDRPEPAA